MAWVFNKFNRGEIDDLALARGDVDKVENSCALMLNMLPRRMGPMSYRPGFGYLQDMYSTSEKMIPFVRDVDDTAILEMTNEAMRVTIDGVAVTRTAVTTTITNETFDTNITGWTDDSGAGSSTAWASGGYAKLLGAKTTSAVLYQTSTTTDIGQPHGLRIVIVEGPVKVRIGTDGAYSDDIFVKDLNPGNYSLTFTPGTAFTVTLSNDNDYASYVSEVSIEGAGEMIIPHDVTTTYLGSIRYRQSADVIYCSQGNGLPFKILRYGTESWGIAALRVNDGPFDVINTTSVTLTPGALVGNTTLTASASLFKTSDEGRLFKLASDGQVVTASVTTDDAGTDGIFVSGLGALRPNQFFPNIQELQKKSRKFRVNISGLTGTGTTVHLQTSIDGSTWTDVQQYTTNESSNYDDQLDNQDVYYRLHIKTGNYSSGPIVMTLSYPSGSISGVCRIINVVSGTLANIQVVKAFGATTATRNWYTGQWGGDNGYPKAINIFEGRLWLAGPDIWGSVSDEYESFDRSIVGDSASIYRSVGFGPVPNPYWLADSSRLIMGILSDEINIRSDAFGAVLTPFNVNIKPGTNQGAANVSPIRIDDRIYFVQRSKKKIYEVQYDLTTDRTVPSDLMNLNETICSAGIKRIVFTRQPETRIWALLDDGTLRVFTFDRSEEQAAWSRVETQSGDTIDDIVVLPSADEDRVYVSVTRANGRYLELLALQSEAEGGSTSKHFDSFVLKTSPGTTITGLDHLEGETVYVWADGQQRATTYTVSSGQITVGDSWTNVVIGLRYNGDWKSNKLNDYSRFPTVTEKARITHLGMVARNFWHDGLTYGRDFDNLKPMPDIEKGTIVDTTAVDDYDTVPFVFPGEFNTDSRICIRFTAPVTVMALTYKVKESKELARPSQDKG